MRGEIVGFGILLILLITGCKKEKLSEKNFIGNWKCDKYTYVYWNGADTSITFTEEIDSACFMNISASNASQFYMGIGTSNMPLLLNQDTTGGYALSLPLMFNGPFAIQNNSDNLDGNNNWDFLESTVEYGIDRQLRATCQFKVLDDNHLNVKVLLRQTTGLTHKYTYALLELTK